MGALIALPSTAQAADTPPLVETGPADYFPADQDLVEVTGTVNALGTQLTECYFEYGTTVAYGMRAEAWGESCNSEFTPVSNEPKEVKGKLLTFSPGVVYHYRLVARNQFGLGVGADRTVGTTGDETPPKEEPVEESHEPAPAPSDPTQPYSPPPTGSPSYPTDWPTFAEEPGCPTLKLIGVRGSDETDGLGRPVGAFRRALQRDLQWRFAVSSVDYPARIWPWRYEGSVKDGVKDLNMQIASDPCRSESLYILAGYSQGAQVIGDAIEDRGRGWSKKNIFATVFFGDPKFDPSLRGVTFFGNFARSKKGVFGGRSNRNVFVGYNLLSFCVRLDPFCQSNKKQIAEGVIAKGMYAGHEAYRQVEAQEAAREVALAWRKR
ncbi:MAG TPA: cutinase family protein [Chloroflexota bacterium]|nr:cutinase family protein [Chloroflexota bacterium]